MRRSIGIPLALGIGLAILVLLLAVGWQILVLDDPRSLTQGLSTGAACRSVPARSSSSATRSNRSTASAAPTSTSTTSSAIVSATPRSGVFCRSR